jgi:hypothetical protein
MPNHVENDLYFNGTQEDIEAVLAFIGATEDPPIFDFRRLLPYPSPYKDMDNDHKLMIPDLDYSIARDTPEWTAQVAARDAGRATYRAKWGTDKDGYNSGGYEWCTRAWGTKWEAYEVKRRDYDSPCLTYQTAWSPSESIIVALAKQFPTVTFSLEYFEHGMEFCGGLTCPSEDDYYDDDKRWHAGIITHKWRTDQYRGKRGG